MMRRSCSTATCRWRRLQNSRTRRATDPKAADIGGQLALWVHHYNWHRSHESLHGDTPINRVCQLADKTPLWAAVGDAYDPTEEPIQIRPHAVDTALRALK